MVKGVKQAFGFLEDISPDKLLSVLKGLDFTPDEVAPFTQEPEGTPYGRSLLMKNEKMEIYLMYWPPHSKSFPHDHGASFGVGTVISGKLTEVRYELDAWGFPQFKSEASAPAGSTFHIARGEIHALENRTDQPLITLHVYVPPIKGMKTYDLDMRVIRVVRDDCGAWRPNQEHQIIAEEKIS